MFSSSQWLPIINTSSPSQCSDESVQYSVRLIYVLSTSLISFLGGPFSQQFSLVIYGTIEVANYFYEVMEGSFVVGGVS